MEILLTIVIIAVVGMAVMMMRRQEDVIKDYIDSEFVILKDCRGKKLA